MQMYVHVSQLKGIKPHIQMWILSQFERTQKANTVELSMWYVPGSVVFLAGFLHFMNDNFAHLNGLVLRGWVAFFKFATYKKVILLWNALLRLPHSEFYYFVLNIHTTDLKNELKFLLSMQLLSFRLLKVLCKASSSLQKKLASVLQNLLLSMPEIIREAMLLLCTRQILCMLTLLFWEEQEIVICI